MTIGGRPPLTDSATQPPATPTTPTTPAVLVCPACELEAADSDAFCEGCGTALRPPQPCPSCGETDIDEDAFCTACGLRRDNRGAGDRSEVDLGRAAGVSDRGLVHRSNEDGMDLALAPWPVAVVCDGVSTAPDSGPAARAAAVAAAAVLTAALDTAALDTATTDASFDAAEALADAVAAAQQAVLDRPVKVSGSGPACTFVAAVVVADVLTVGWLGDSRAYLFGTDGPVRLTADDTVAAQAARAGLIPPEAAETGRGAHTITRWLGRDNGGNLTPHVTSTRLTGPGRVVVCSDGMWNYASDAATLAGHVAGVPAGAPPIDVARHLTEVALRAGGHDNITVVVLDLEPAIKQDGESQPEFPHGSPRPTRSHRPGHNLPAPGDPWVPQLPPAPGPTPNAGQNSR